jgi:cytochrome c-type biogenesis protein CcmH
MFPYRQDTPLPALRADLPRKGGGDSVARPAPSPLAGEGWGGGCFRTTIFRLVALAFIAICIAAPTSVFAVEPDEILKNPALEARARHLSEELRCMVCQNQSIDDSAAPLARDLRLLVRQRLVAGDSNRQVLDYIVARYGDFVLLKPPFKLDTLLLWGLPPAALIAGLMALVVMARRRKTLNLQPAALTPQERERLATLVGPGAPDA